jgi:H/ACA ribonucleoprotein complex subunit 3
MKPFYINNTKVVLKPSDLFGEGGEAEIYKLDSKTALKLYKTPAHPQYRDDSPFGKAQRLQAQQRLQIYQIKLPQFPKGLAPHLVEPRDLVYDTPNQSRTIVGYTMPLVAQAHSLHEFAQRTFRESSGITLDDVIAVFTDLHRTVSDLHSNDVVIGDFNHLNVLVSGTDAFIVDADSMQFGNFKCNTFTTRYTDPKILVSVNGEIKMSKPYSVETDWYAYSVLLFESLLHVHPYGGVYKGKPGAQLSADERPLKRVSVFHNNVTYPAAANGLHTLPGEVLNFFSKVIEEDLRVAFPTRLLEALNPLKTQLLVNKVATSATITQSNQAQKTEGGTTSRAVFSTPGVILAVSHDSGNLRYLYHDGEKFVRENGEVVLNGNLDPGLKFAIQGTSTIIGKGSRSFLFADDGLRLPLKVDQYRGHEPVFDANAEQTFFIEDGQLFKQTPARKTFIDDVLKEQTRIWMGPKFGFGFYLAGEFRRAFLFDGEVAGRTLIDTDALQGNLLSVKCRFSDERLWLIVHFEQYGRILNRITSIDRHGKVFGTIEAIDSNSTWTDFSDSSCAAAFPLQAGGQLETLLVATPSGIARIESINYQPRVTKIYDGTDQFAQPGDNLLFAKSGLYAWTSKSIHKITTN